MMSKTTSTAKQASSLSTSVNRWFRDSRGANLVEYIILVGVVALLALGGFKLFGGKVWDKAEKQAEQVSTIGN